MLLNEKKEIYKYLYKVHHHFTSIFNYLSFFSTSFETPAPSSSSTSCVGYALKLLNKNLAAKNKNMLPIRKGKTTHIRIVITVDYLATGYFTN